MTQYFVRKHPKMIATDIETQLKTRYTYQSVRELKKYYPKTEFVWIAGTDNARIFHRWDKWQALLKCIPFIFYNRPPNRMSIQRNAISLYKGRKDVYFSLKGKTRNISSTALRQNKFPKTLKILYTKFMKGRF